MKEIEIIPIAERKAERRGISIEWIKETLRAPSQTVEGYGGRSVAQKEIYDRRVGIFAESGFRGKRTNM